MVVVVSKKHYLHSLLITRCVVCLFCFFLMCSFLWCTYMPTEMLIIVQCSFFLSFQASCFKSHQKHLIKSLKKFMFIWLLSFLNGCVVFVLFVCLFVCFWFFAWNNIDWGTTRKCRCANNSGLFCLIWGSGLKGHCACPHGCSHIPKF